LRRGVPGTTLFTMETLTVNGSLFLIGLAPVLTGVVALSLPAGHRLEAVLALVVGAGVGLAGLAIGTAFANSEIEAEQTAFFVASIVGFISVLVMLGVIRRRSS
jgi:hypothetical protein